MSATAMMQVSRRSRSACGMHLRIYGPRSWSRGSVALLRPAGQEEQRLWVLVPRPHLLSPQELLKGEPVVDTVQTVTGK